MLKLLTLRSLKKQTDEKNEKVIQTEQCFILSPSCYVSPLVIKLNGEFLFIKALLFFRFPGPEFGPRTAAGHGQSYSENRVRKTPQPGQSSLVIHFHCCQ